MFALLAWRAVRVSLTSRGCSMADKVVAVRSAGVKRSCTCFQESICVFMYKIGGLCVIRLFLLKYARHSVWYLAMPSNLLEMEI